MANHYIRASATGSATGADWNNAYTDIPATLTRGDTYYISSGSYATYEFNDTDDGQFITLKKATSGDHGTDTGWNDTFGSGSAVFDYRFRFTRGHYIIDGVTGGGAGQWDNYGLYGFRIENYTSGSASQIIRIESGSTNIAIKHTHLTYPDRPTLFHIGWLCPVLLHHRKTR